jgi:hypothetical protein
MGDTVTGPVGVVLGAPQLVFVCVQYYETFMAYINQKKELSTYCAFFLVQHKQFQYWISRAMPDGKTLLTDDVTKQDLTMALLDQTREAFEDAQKFTQWYGKRSLFDWFSRKQELKASIQDVSMTRRLAWALEGSKSAEKLLVLLERSNKALQLVWNMSSDSFQRQLLPELDDFNSLSGLRLIEGALKREESKEYCGILTAVRLRRACLEEMHAERNHSNDLVGARTRDNLELRLTDFKNPEIFFADKLPKVTTTVNGDQVLLECKRYEYEKSARMPTQSRFNETVAAGITRLAHDLAKPMKPWKLKTLDCVGFIKLSWDRTRWPGHVLAFKLPANVHPEPVSLRRVINDTSNTCGLPLGHRFTLALGLTNAVYSLLSVGWLHKGIRSRSILFFKPRDAPPTENWLPSPKDFFLMGFESSRPIDVMYLSGRLEAVELEDKFYVYPKYFHDCTMGYKPGFDLFSLGMVLVEIALWRTSENLMQDVSEQERALPKDQKEIVANFLIPMVERTVGVVYADCVRLCINGEFCDQDELRKLLMAFDKQVIANLEKCYA